MLFAHLILAHLVGDFLLQPSSLVLWKMRSKIGVLVHCSVHFFVNIVVLIPVLSQKPLDILLISLFISSIHFFIDLSKISYDLKHDNKPTSFVIDQILHVLSLILTFVVYERYFGPYVDFTKVSSDKIIYNISFIIFLCMTIFVTSVVDIYQYQKQSHKDFSGKIYINRPKKLKRILALSLIYLMITLLIYLIPKS